MKGKLAKTAVLAIFCLSAVGVYFNWSSLFRLEYSAYQNAGEVLAIAVFALYVGHFIGTEVAWKLKAVALGIFIWVYVPAMLGTKAGLGVSLFLASMIGVIACITFVCKPSPSLNIWILNS